MFQKEKKSLSSKIIIAGEGGQGIQTIAEIIVKAANEEGLHALYVPNFGVEQRGGVSVAFVQISDHPLNYPKFDICDLLVLFSKRAVERTKNYIGIKTFILYNSSLIETESLEKSEKKSGLDVTNIAREKWGEKSANLIMLGLILQKIPYLKKETIQTQIEKRFTAKLIKYPRIIKQNQEAFEYGFKTKI